MLCHWLFALLFVRFGACTRREQQHNKCDSAKQNRLDLPHQMKSFLHTSSSCGIMINHSAQIINIYKLSSSRVSKTASCIERQVSLKVVPILLKFTCEHDLVLVYNDIKIKLPAHFLTHWDWQSVATPNVSWMFVVTAIYA